MEVEILISWRQCSPHSSIAELILSNIFLEGLLHLKTRAIVTKPNCGRRTMQGLLSLKTCRWKLIYLESCSFWCLSLLIFEIHVKAIGYLSHSIELFSVKCKQFIAHISDSVGFYNYGLWIYWRGKGYNSWNLDLQK